MALATPIVLDWSRRLGLYDQPDADRKVHDRPIPRTGGLAIAAGLLVPFIGLAFWGNDFSAELRQDEERLVAFIGGFAAILGLGVYDDIKGVGAWGKLSVQMLVGMLLWTSELRVSTLTVFDHYIDLGLWSLPLTMLWVAGFVNAMNLIDGLDGLAAGVAFFASASLFFKTIQIHRAVDKEKAVLVYTVISTRVIEGSPYNSISVVPTAVR